MKCQANWTCLNECSIQILTHLFIIITSFVNERCLDLRIEMIFEMKIPNVISPN